MNKHRLTGGWQILVIVFVATRRVHGIKGNVCKRYGEGCSYDIHHVGITCTNLAVSKGISR